MYMMLHDVYFNFRTLVFILLVVNDQSGQVLPIMKETGFDVVTRELSTGSKINQIYSKNSSDKKYLS